MPKRESRYVRVARFAYQLTQEAIPPFSHPKSPHRFTQPQLAACVLMMFYLNLSYRDREEWLLASEAVCQTLDLTHIPNHSTLQRTFKKLCRIVLDQLKNHLLDQLAVDEEVIATDSTRFTPSQANAYFQARSGRTIREYVKGAYAVGTESQLIVGWRAGSVHTSDIAALPSLRQQAQRYGHREMGHRAWVLIADKGFDGRTARPGDLIPLIRRSGNVLDSERLARAELVSAARLDGLYGQRWKAETVHSVIKRKFGDTIRSRSVCLQKREPIIKGWVYNLHR